MVNQNQLLLEAEQLMEAIHSELYWYLDRYSNQEQRELIRRILTCAITYYEQTQTPRTPSESESSTCSETEFNWDSGDSQW